MGTEPEEEDRPGHWLGVAVMGLLQGHLQGLLQRHRMEEGSVGLLCTPEVVVPVEGIPGVVVPVEGIPGVVLYSPGEDLTGKEGDQSPPLSSLQSDAAKMQI